jgi:plastocyanin
MKTYRTEASQRHINFRLVISGFVAILLIGSVALQALFASPAAAAAKTVVVTMTDTPPRYIPEDLKISVNTTVEWKNTTKGIHDVSTEASDAQNKNDVHLPSGAKPFDSGFLTPGQIWKHKFTVPGHYTYFCLPHEKDRMIGHIDVVP